MIRITVTIASLAFCTALSAAASAQTGSGNNAVSIRPKAEETLGPTRAAPPPALPGARSQGGAAPASKLPTDMSPNDALFDAINRGDIAAARDSLSRGADLNAQNVLGMTPMELSVDLGRNDISFLLLSMRGGTVPRNGPASDQAELAARAGRRGEKKATAVKLTVTPNAAIRAPVLFANNGGSPVPEAGFLGFDNGRAMR